jgi:hypothetical protein
VSFVVAQRGRTLTLALLRHVLLLDFHGSLLCAQKTNLLAKFVGCELLRVAVFKGNRRGLALKDAFDLEISWCVVSISTWCRYYSLNLLRERYWNM